MISNVLSCVIFLFLIDKFVITILGNYPLVIFILNGRDWFLPFCDFNGFYMKIIQRVNPSVSDQYQSLCISKLTHYVYNSAKTCSACTSKLSLITIFYFRLHSQDLQTFNWNTCYLTCISLIFPVTRLQFYNFLRKLLMNAKTKVWGTFHRQIHFTWY